MIYILLFLVFMLVGESELAAKKNQASDEAEQQIYVYIRGKLALSCLVASAHAMTLWAIGCELWLVFFVLTFSLNFVPNIGMFIAECRKLAQTVMSSLASPAPMAPAVAVCGAKGARRGRTIQPLGRAPSDPSLATLPSA